MNTTTSLVLIAVGAAIIFWTNRRAFNRRNAVGVQEFSSYGHSLLIRGVERVVRIVAWLLIVSGAGGVLMAFLGVHP